jgi:hypothetical protein
MEYPESLVVVLVAVDVGFVTGGGTGVVTTVGFCFFWTGEDVEDIPGE